MNRFHVFLSTIFIFFLLIIQTTASVYTYIPGNSTVSPISPDVIFVPSSSLGVSSTLGQNRTSATVNIKASATTQEITTNGYFDAGPSPWIFIPGTYINRGFWYPSLYGRTGVVSLSGGGTGIFISDRASIYQQITWPSFTVGSADVNISYYILANLTADIISAQFRIGYRILDQANNVVTSNVQTVVSTSSTTVNTGWNVIVLPINTAALTPGTNYNLHIVVEISLFLFSFRITPRFEVEYALDWSILTVSPLNPVFQGPAIHMNTTLSSYNVSVILNSFSTVGNVDVKLWLRNHTNTVDSTAIEIQNSVLISSQTSELIMAPVPLGYLSLDILVEAEIQAGGSVTLNLTVKYRFEDGVYVEYPLTIVIVDPPNRGGNNVIFYYDKPIPLVRRS